MSKPEANVIFVLGPPGCGKGTVCKRAATEHVGYLHLSVADYLRELALPRALPEIEWLDWQRVREHLRGNKAIPSKILIKILQHKIGRMLEGTITPRCILVDGFPRNQETALAFGEKICNPRHVIVLHCEREIAKQRYLSRPFRMRYEDEERFEQLSNEYEENMKLVLATYDQTIKSEIHVNGDQEDCYFQFITTLPSGPMYF
ncbi:P-loop containing nucleoside triphosphate hydrolase protein [Hypomontagnella submonticulosa]|nr:P-loop containing nucleoside triphosphate hydrolase protein [Hypomontagnella submonticulosa]